MTRPDDGPDHPARNCDCEFHTARRAYQRDYMPDYRRGARRRPDAAPKPEPRERLRLPHFRTREAIETAIARDWSTSRIMRDLRTSYEDVRAVRLFLDRINETAA